MNLTEHTISVLRSHGEHVLADQLEYDQFFPPASHHSRVTPGNAAPCPPGETARGVVAPGGKNLQ